MKQSPNPIRSAGMAVLFGLVLANVGAVLPSHASDDLEKTGAKDFQAFCATCHGWGGAGAGPVADVLSVEPPNLTLIADRNGGVFPTEKVYKQIDGLEMPRAHGTKQMPVWGVWFAYEAIADSLHTGDKTPPPEKIDKRIRGLVAFLASIQE